jgi:hypothetical protein
MNPEEISRIRKTAKVFFISIDVLEIQYFLTINNSEIIK